MVIERYVPLSLFVSSFFIHTFMSCELEDTWEGIRAKKPTILWFGCVKYFRRSYSSSLCEWKCTLHAIAN